MTTTEGSIRWTAGIWAGLISGAVFLVLEMVMVPVFLGNPMWAPPRMIAAIGMGKDVLPPPGTFDLGIVAVALVIHFGLSIIFGLSLVPLIHKLGAGVAVVIGLVFGLVLYFVNFYGFTAIFPWFANARNWVTIFTHVVFGGLAAWIYKALSARSLTAESSEVGS